MLRLKEFEKFEFDCNNYMEQNKIITVFTALPRVNVTVSFADKYNVSILTCMVLSSSV